MEHLDKLAEDAVKEAIRSTVANGKRANGGSVPPEAEQILMKKARRRLARTEARNKVQQAVERLRDRKEIKAPRDKQHDWAVVSRGPPSTTGSSGQASEERGSAAPSET